MKFFADASFLYNTYYPGQAHAALARRLCARWDFKIFSSAAAILEFRLGSVWEAKHEDGWNRFQQDKQSGKVAEVAVDWEKLFSDFESVVLQQGRFVQPDLLDGLHVLAAKQIGATHFLSFDFLSRQRAFARAVGLKVLPEKLPGEY